MTDPAPPDAPPPMPRWVKVSLALAALFIVIFAAVHLAGGGFHGHMHGAGSATAATDAGAASASP